MNQPTLPISELSFSTHTSSFSVLLHSWNKTSLKECPTPQFAVQNTFSKWVISDYERFVRPDTNLFDTAICIQLTKDDKVFSTLQHSNMVAD